MLEMMKCSLSLLNGRQRDQCSGPMTIYPSTQVQVWWQCILPLKQETANVKSVTVIRKAYNRFIHLVKYVFHFHFRKCSPHQCTLNCQSFSKRDRFWKIKRTSLHWFCSQLTQTQAGGLYEWLVAHEGRSRGSSWEFFSLSQKSDGWFSAITLVSHRVHRVDQVDQVDRVEEREVENFWEFCSNQKSGGRFLASVLLLLLLCTPWKKDRFFGVIQVIDIRVMLFIQSSHYFDLIYACL